MRSNAASLGRASVGGVGRAEHGIRYAVDVLQSTSCAAPSGELIVVVCWCTLPSPVLFADAVADTPPSAVRWTLVCVSSPLAVALPSFMATFCWGFKVQASEICRLLSSGPWTCCEPCRKRWRAGSRDQEPPQSRSPVSIPAFQGVRQPHRQAPHPPLKHSAGQTQSQCNSTPCLTPEFLGLLIKKRQADKGSLLGILRSTAITPHPTPIHLPDVALLLHWISTRLWDGHAFIIVFKKISRA